ncbi:5'-nucleotidase domain-containing protein 1 [Belonocnema kinseyi]|uniref:5'-nucleotidase domain-containing protein 1 n=1 Tax=Belonocnema kinseyi TaxID=2817044 RepID=UPI00143DDC15|nr:5'-nucleotidase domain-containing protein 1 [Belonocnema kinseyi]
MSMRQLSLIFQTFNVLDNHLKVVFFSYKVIFKTNKFDCQKRLFCVFPPPRNMSTIRLCDYDCVGFDLDNTLLQYNITNLITLEYQLLVDFLVDMKKYSPKYLKEPFTEKVMDFMQKGLILDFDRGNILKLDASGRIWRASHGTKLLTLEELESTYPGLRWDVTDKFFQDMFSTWNGELSLKIRALLDYFDMPVSLIFAKIVDTLDEEQKPSVYNIWPDIMEGLTHIFSREQFQNNGDFFSALKSNPEKYLHLCSSDTISWIRELKKKRKNFLITGSNADFIDFTAGYAFGKDWRSLFDIVVCYAKKPGFFVPTGRDFVPTGRDFLPTGRDFLRLEGYEEKCTIEAKELKEGGIYSQGNWKELTDFFTRITGKNNPKCLYLGDNLIQDVYVPNAFRDCDIIVVVDEQLAEKMVHHELSHSDEIIINSKFWGSYFSLEEPEGYRDSYWNHIIRNHSKVCIPKVEVIATIPLDQPIECFDKETKNANGYFPAKPLSLHV